MKKKIKNIEECRKLFEIEIPSEEVNKQMEECYKKIEKVAKIPGYRAGKIPKDLLEKHYGDQATKEVVEDLIGDAYQKAIEESGFIPLGFPQISDVKLDDKKTLSFKAEFNIRPKIELKQYKGLKLNKKAIEIKEEDVERSTKTLQESTAKFKNTEARPVQIGDYIICDSEVFVDGKAIAKKRENIWMPVEEKSYIPNLSTGLVGTAIGDEKEIETILPQDFSNKEYANKRAIFKIKIKEIKEKILSEIDDAFAKDAGYNNLAELKDSLRALLKNQAERQVRQDLENQIVEQLLGSSKFNVPASLVERQTQHLFEEEKNNLLKQGLKEDDIKSKEKELKDKMRPWATKQIKNMFILDEIAHKEDINVSKEELDGTLEAIARQYNKPKEEIEKYYEKNDLISSLRSDIRHSKILEFLIKEARIEEGKQK